MQHDTNRTIGDINGSKEALIQQVEDILSVALVTASDDGRLQLRFLTPLMGLKVWASQDACQDYRLTTPEKHRPGLEYVTASYVWNHTQPTAGLPTPPDFRVWDSALNPVTPRPIRCPKVVFDRVMRFARRMNCPYIWIDQECIDQDDEQDVKKHLNIMHRVYSESRWTVAILSKSLFKKEQVSSIIDITKHTQGPGSTDRVKQKSAVLEYIVRDKWFTRAWPFQEKQCARSLHLSLPAGRSMDDLNADDQASFVIGRDFCVDMACLSSWISSISGHPLLSSTKLSEALIPRPTTGINHPSAAASDVMNANGTTILHENFLKLEKCENLILADRLSILGNICNLPCRLWSDRLNNATYSYSNCILALALANIYPDQMQRTVALNSTMYQTVSQLQIAAVLKTLGLERARQLSDLT